VEELAEILAVDFGASGGMPTLNEDLRWEDQEQALLFACSSLIAIVKDDSSRAVQFSHFSVKEFLTSDRLATSTMDASHYHHILLEPSHTIMAQACLSVLLRFDSHISKDSLKDFPLALYASEHFGDHAEFGNVFAHVRDGIDDLLDADKPHFAAWLWVRQGESEGPPERPEASPLYHVARLGFCGMVDHLISKRPADLSVRGRYGIPLHASLYNGHADVSLLLIGHCMDVNVRGKDGQTLLHMAVDSGLLEVIRTLIGRGATINARDSNGRTPLHPTGHGDNGTFDDQYFDVVRCLLEYGADVNAQADTDHPTPLHLASYHGGFKVAQLLLDHGADINVRDKDGRTPLHGTLVDMTDDLDDYFFDTVRFLLEHGANVHGLDNDHATPLHVASQCGGTKAARLLLEHGADVHALDGNHSTPLHFASHSGNAKTARLLLEHNADVHALDNDHSTPLHFISQHSDAGAACILLEHGALVDARDNKGLTPLQVALQRGNAKVARILLEHGANIDTRNKEGQTPRNLLLAMWSDIRPDDDIDNIRFFLGRGADVDAIDDNHSGLLHVASYWGSVEVARLLLEHGANIDVRNSGGQTPLHRALIETKDMAFYSIFDGIQLLLEHGADVDALDNDNSAPLHMASHYGSVRATRLLLKHGANVHLQNNDGHTPSQVASANGHEEIALLLSEHSQSEQKM
jgi:cytohesin